MKRGVGSWMRGCLLGGLVLASGCGGEQVNAIVPDEVEIEGGRETPVSPRALPPPPPVSPPSLFNPVYSDAWLWLVRDPPEERGEVEAEQVVRSFYTTHRALGARGIPGGYQISRYRPWISRRIADAFALGAIERDAFIAAHPDAKPPFIDEELFVSLSEGFTAYRIAARTALPDGRVAFEVRLTYRDHQGRAEWTDRAIVVRESRRWVLDDIEYGGDWGFAQRGSLSGLFSAEAKQ